MGSHCRNSNGCIFSNSNIGKLELNVVDRPGKVLLTPNGGRLPYVMISDEEFQLKTFMLHQHSRHHLGGDETKKYLNTGCHDPKELLKMPSKFLQQDGEL